MKKSRYKLAGFTTALLTLLPAFVLASGQMRIVNQLLTPVVSV
jgi:hypothetical protein